MAALWQLRDTDMAHPVVKPLHLQCPLCKTQFEIGTASIREPCVSWSSSRDGIGTLEFTIEVWVRHTCPDGTAITGTPA